jgi:hypothetical protein
MAMLIAYHLRKVVASRGIGRVGGDDAVVEAGDTSSLCGGVHFRYNVHESAGQKGDLTLASIS